MAYELRPYQVEAVNIALDRLRTYGKPFVIQMATGAGKSLVIADICHKLDEPVLVLQPSKELLEQNHAKLLSYGITDVGIYSASKKSKEIAKYTYATIGSIYKKPELFKHFKYVVIDECHGVNPKGFGMYKTFLAAIGCQRVCGLTATPYRIVQKYTTWNGQLYYTASLRVINRIHPFFFKQIAYKIETDQLIRMGYLVSIKYHADQVNLDRLIVNSTGADFTTDSLEEWAGSKVDRIEGIIRFVDTPAKRNLVFCSSIRQANKVLERFEGENDIDVRLVTGDTPVKERAATVEAFRRGEFKHLLNVGVFTVGFDVPELNSIVLARPTMSLALYYQMIGRGVRLDPADPAKVLRVFDLAGVSERLGRVETIKLAKEPPPNHFKDMVQSEVGRMDETVLFAFKVKRKELQNV